MTKDRVQVYNPVRRRWVKIDTTTGRVLATKMTPGPWSNIPVRQKEDASDPPGDS